MIKTIRTSCHPQANGREPQNGEMQWKLSFPLENGDDYLELQIGERGRNALLTMLRQEEADDIAEGKVKT